MDAGSWRASLRWPELTHPYDEAVRAAVEFILERAGPEHILAIYVAGSVLRGEGGPLSDLDIFVVHDNSWRQRVQTRFGGVPVEMFFNPPHRVRLTFEEERRRRRPSAAHMIATGFAMYESETAAALRAEARALLDMGPPALDADEANRAKYLAVSLLEDGQDVAALDPAASLLLLARAVDAAVRHRYGLAGRWEPRDKELVRRLADLDPELLRLVQAFSSACDPSQRLEAARRIVQHCTGVTESFEWESPREPIPAPGETPGLR